MGNKRIALYGGTFDPVHNGHLAVARNVVQLFGLTELLFVPARRAPHKLSRAASSPAHRYAMLALATQLDSQLRISMFELSSEEPRYTIDTLRHFRAELGADNELFFVMGADSWSEIDTWREWQSLPQIANLIVVTRPGYRLKGVAGFENVVDVRGWDADRVQRQLDAATKNEIYVTDAAQVDVSATESREAGQRGDEGKLAELLPPAVADYIRKYELYQKSNEN